MNKRKIRCFSIYIKVGKNYNVEIFYPLNGGWANLSLLICLKCGELFVIEYENQNLEYIINTLSTCNMSCPKCASLFKDSIVSYPEQFLAPDKSIGRFETPSYFSSELDVKIIEVWDIGPVLRNR